MAPPRGHRVVHRASRFSCIFGLGRVKKWGAPSVLWVVDRKVVKHTVRAGATLVEVPIRIRFEFGLREKRFVAGTLSYTFLYNRPELLRRFPRLDAERLEADIERAVERALVEHLKFRGYASGEVKLFDLPERVDSEDVETQAALGGDTAGGEPDREENATPRIILPSTVREG